MRIISHLFQSENSIKNFIGFIISPVLFILIVLFVDLKPGNPQVTYTLAIAFLMAVWWVTEVIPLAATALVPIVLFPLFGIMNGKAVSASYVNDVIFLFIGGFIVALAMQKWNLHKRIAIRILMVTGTSPLRILLGFMVATAFLSMWISNTATTMMMVPILLSIVSKLEEHVDKEELAKYSVGLLLGVAYSASIGGIATLVGTPPNPAFLEIFRIMFPKGPEISFSTWFIFALPITVIFFVFTWQYLYWIYKPKSSFEALKNISFKQQYKDLGAMSAEERRVMVVFVALVVLWLTRTGLNLGSIDIPGWSELLAHPKYINDGTVAIAMGLILFVIPAKNKGTQKLMDWHTSKELPWGIVLLFGGGFALAHGFKTSGLSLWFGEQLQGAADLNPFLIIGIIAFLTTFLTELTSNTASIQMLLPVLAGLSVSIGINPLILMLPATISASMAFMLPVATPPNAIIFASHRVRILEMTKTGFVLNLVGVIIVTFMTYYWGAWVFDFDPTVLPEWAM